LLRRGKLNFEKKKADVKPSGGRIVKEGAVCAGGERGQPLAGRKKAAI